ncbi:RRM1_TatSF1_like and RRM2_TatSF1_like domain-containing protein barc [Anticarsia gemmatalis]|uniref:RRM1_TatSF1_like and RRM2_TatSF1_like domain-containing protein barc n=1 Tax=Anticarsia gemmatalis TaxID=129554 RepID=UPI003F76F557
MAKNEKGPKTGFVIKLSNETVQKLTEEEQQAKTRLEEEAKATSASNEPDKLHSTEKDPVNPDLDSNKDITKEVSDSKQDKKDIDSKSKGDKNETKSSTDNKSDKKEADSTSWDDHAPYITYEGEEAIYTDPSTHQKYLWCKESNSWKPQEIVGRVYSYEDDTHIYTEADGSKFFWDVDKKAWIPKVDDDFLAFYQMSYGFIDNKAPEKPEVEEKKKQPKQAEPTPGTIKRKLEPQWFQPSEETNTKVYVSNLPLDLTEEEFVNFMQKCGLVERDPSTQKMKIKLYMDKEQNCFKGDALCTYIKIESVDLALKLLDGSDLKGNKIKVERAHFQMKGDYNPALKPKKKKKKELEKIKKMQQKLFDWRPEKFVGERSKHERVVIVKNLFHPTDFDKEVQLILDYQQDLREECTKCGEVRKVVIYDRHPEGVAQITMKEPEMADAVVELINGRWFGKRQITAEIWDGRTKYRIAETDAEISKRIGKWDQFLEGKDGEEGGKKVDPESKDSSQASKEKSMEVTNTVATEKSIEATNDVEMAVNKSE